MIPKLPLFPPFAYISNVQMESSQPPFSFRFTVSWLPDGERALKMSGDVLSVLAISDGTKSSSDMLEELRQVSPSLTQSQLNKVLHSLSQDGLLLDAELCGYLSNNTRYSRHTEFFSMFTPNAGHIQQRLQQADVAIVGVGGIGTWVAYMLVGAGVGRLRLIDGDLVEESNLSRQVLFDTEGIGSPKVVAAKSRLLKINPEVEIRTECHFISDSESLNDAMNGTDLIIVSADDPQSLKDDVDKFSVSERVPWLSAGYRGAIGLCGPLFVPGRTGCLNCNESGLREIENATSLPLVSDINSRFQPPSFGPLNGLVASIAAYDSICFLAGLFDSVRTEGSTLRIGTPSFEVTVHPWVKSEQCNRCGSIEDASDQG